MNATVCIDIAANKDNLGEALDKAFRRRPAKIVFIGSDAALELKAREGGFEVEVLPSGSAVPQGALVAPPSVGTQRSRDFVLAANMIAARRNQ